MVRHDDNTVIAAPPSSLFRSIKPALAALTLICLLSGRSAAAQDRPTDQEQAVKIPPATALTIETPAIPTDELALLVKPLTADELKVEADAWMDLLRAKVTETSRAELAVKQKNKAIDKAEQAKEVLEETSEVMEEVEASSTKAEAGSAPEAAADAESLARKAQNAVEESVDSIDQVVDTMEQVAADGAVQEAMMSETGNEAGDLADSAELARRTTAEVSRAAVRAADAAEQGESERAARLAGETAEAAAEASSALREASNAVTDTVSAQSGTEVLADRETLDETALLATRLAEGQKEDKQEILTNVTALRDEVTGLIDRLNVVLDELSLKLGKAANGQEHESIIPYRLYAAAVGGIEVDVSDTQALWTTIIGWLRSDVGGLRLARNLGTFLLWVSGFWLLGWILGRVVNQALKMTRITVELMRGVIVRLVRRLTLLVGILLGLSAIGFNVGPIMALIGAAGFVIAFALQDTLSNFASGIMIMIYHPFDVGDIISVGGVTGEARSMNLVSTTIATPDNQLLIVPNNTIWGNVINNQTGSPTRRVDLVFRISYEDDLSQAQDILEKVVAQHPLVLEQPEPTIAVQELDDFSVNFICRPWTNTEDYWQVYREITRSVKEHFREIGMVPPLLQHNVPAARLAGHGLAEKLTRA